MYRCRRTVHPREQAPQWCLSVRPDTDSLNVQPIACMPACCLEMRAEAEWQDTFAAHKCHCASTHADNGPVVTLESWRCLTMHGAVLSHKAA